MRRVCNLIWLALVGAFNPRASLEAETMILRHQPQPAVYGQRSESLLRVEGSIKDVCFNPAPRTISNGSSGLSSTAISRLTLTLSGWSSCSYEGRLRLFCERPLCVRLC